MRAAVASLVGLLLCATGCPKAPSGATNNRRDAARAPSTAAQADGGTPRRVDPCAILEPTQRDLVVARVGQQSLTLCDFTRRVNSQNPYLRARFNAPEQRRALLQSWVDAELLAAEAEHQGLDREPEVRRAVILQLARRLEQSTRDAVPDPTITDAEVRAYYEAHRAEYDTDAEVRASQIVLRTRAEAERLLADVRAHAADDAYFRQQAHAHSVDVPSQARDGDLMFFPRNGGATVMPEVAEAAFGMHTNGEILDRVVESAHGGIDHGPGFHILRLTARRDALHRTIDDEQVRIRRRLTTERLNAAQDQAMTALLARLRGSTTVTIDEAALGRVQVDARPQPNEGGAAAPALMGAPGVPMPGVPR